MCVLDVGQGGGGRSYNAVCVRQLVLTLWLIGIFICTVYLVNFDP